MNLQPRVIYADPYNIRFWGLEKLHPFDSCKYGHAWHYLSAQHGLLRPGTLVPPRRPAEEELQLIHPPEYLASLRQSRVVAAALELPFVARLPAFLIDRYVLKAMRWATAGTVLAAQEALSQGMAINLGGGYHHASRDRGEGFCIYADVAIALESLRRTGFSGQVLIIDLDAHQGNGLERIYQDDPQVLIFDMYNSEIYPQDREAGQGIRWNVPLRSGTTDEHYLGQLRERLSEALEECRPALAFYNAGTDIFKDDPLGGLGVTETGVLERDRFVFEQLTQREIPWVMVLSGGYTRVSWRLVAHSVEHVLRRWGPPSS